MQMELGGLTRRRLTSCIRFKEIKVNISVARVVVGAVSLVLMTLCTVEMFARDFLGQTGLLYKNCDELLGLDCSMMWHWRQNGRQISRPYIISAGMKSAGLCTVHRWVTGARIF